MNPKRNSLKKISAATLVASGLPSIWTKPVVNAIVLPAHADTSLPSLNVSYSEPIVLLSDQGGGAAYDTIEELLELDGIPIDTSCDFQLPYRDSGGLYYFFGNPEGSNIDDNAVFVLESEIEGLTIRVGQTLTSFPIPPNVIIYTPASDGAASSEERVSSFTVTVTNPDGSSDSATYSICLYKVTS